MSDIVLEVIRATILLYVVFYLLKTGKKRKELCRSGWGFVIAGFGLLLFGNIVDVTDNFESLNRFIVIGDTPTQAFLEKMVGFMGGFLLLAVGLVRWIPTITGVEQIKQLNEELEKKIAERRQAKEEREKTVAEMERMNRLMMGREKRVIEMKKKVNALLVELGRDPEYQSVLKNGDNEVVSTESSL